LLGLAGIHGGIIPVFGLSSILGYAPDPGSPRWMILCSSEEPFALAFSDFEGYLRLPTSALHSDENFRATREQVKYVNQIASTPDGVRAVIDIQLIMATIRNRISQHRPTKESQK
jgi:chemotaxis signal transduction protein